VCIEEIARSSSRRSLFFPIFCYISHSRFKFAGANRGLGLELCRQLADGDTFSSIYALCRKSSDCLGSLASVSKKVIIVEGVEVVKEESIAVVQKTFRTNVKNALPIHLLVHNAGAYSLPEDIVDEMYDTQTLENITSERMRFSFEINTLAPLRLTQALLPNLKATKEEKDPRKLIIISSAMGSTQANGSGGHYGYRTAKAGVNMIGKSLSIDLKEHNVAVGLGK
jgi:NAD(P)-dependent dehydrogenase (short-subunit alcohol dehydrogenase family)